jgi:hypothetical protein
MKTNDDFSKVIYEFTDTHIEQVQQLYKQVWWAKDRTFDDTKDCI